jgi:hypothetical protein
MGWEKVTPLSYLNAAPGSTVARGAGNRADVDNPDRLTGQPDVNAA